MHLLLMLDPANLRHNIPLKSLDILPARTEGSSFLLLYLPKKTLLIYFKGEADIEYHTMLYEVFVKK